jgi:hypothetical protein
MTPDSSSWPLRPIWGPPILTSLVAHKKTTPYELYGRDGTPTHTHTAKSNGSFTLSTWTCTRVQSFHHRKDGTHRTFPLPHHLHEDVHLGMVIHPRRGWLHPRHPLFLQSRSWHRRYITGRTISEAASHMHPLTFMSQAEEAVFNAIGIPIKICPQELTPNWLAACCCLFTASTLVFYGADWKSACTVDPGGLLEVSASGAIQIDASRLPWR